jgi:hypothetical protein
VISFDGNHYYNQVIPIKGVSIAGLEGQSSQNDGPLYSVIRLPTSLVLTRTSMGKVRVLSAKRDKIDED